MKLKITEYPYVGAILTMEFAMNPCAKLRSVNIRPKHEKKQIPTTAKNRESRKRRWNIRR